MRRILVIDDDEQVRNLLLRILTREGYEVLVAPNGKKGITLCTSTPVDLVITDIVMPEMEGLEVIMALRREFPDMKIIAISGGARLEPGHYLNMAAKLGALHTLQKPFDRAELLGSIRGLLE